MKMKKITLTFFCIFMSILAKAVTFDVEGIRYEITSMDKHEVFVAIIPKSISYPTYSTYSGDIDIPESVEFNNIRFSVVGIGKNAFAECHKLGKISIPQSIKSIEFGAFSNSNIDTITIHEGIEYIGDVAFHDCNNLTYMTLPKTIKSLGTGIFRDCQSLRSVKILSENLIEIPNDTFEGCISLENFIIPSSVTSLGEGAFMTTRKLSTLKIPQNVSVIGNSCFYGSGIESLEIPDAVTELGGRMFYGCSKLKSIKLPAKLKELTESTFRGCSSLENISIPNEIKFIPSYCFYECYKLENVDLPSVLDFIGSSAFAKCNIKNISIPEGTKQIYSEAFWDCKISSISLPSTLEEIGGWAFGIETLNELILPTSLKKIGTKSFASGTIKRIVCLSTTPIECENNVFNNDTYLYSILVVPQEAFDLYKSTNPWKDFFNIQKSTQTGIKYLNDENQDKIETYINIKGQRNNKFFNGINFIKYKNGNVKKVLIKTN